MEWRGSGEFRALARTSLTWWATKSMLDQGKAGKERHPWAGGPHWGQWISKGGRMWINMLGGSRMRESGILEMTARAGRWLWHEVVEVEEGKIIADQGAQKLEARELDGYPCECWSHLDDGRTWEGEGEYETGATVFEHEKKVGKWQHLGGETAEGCKHGSTEGISPTPGPCSTWHVREPRAITWRVKCLGWNARFQDIGRIGLQVCRCKYNLLPHRVQYIL